MSAVLQQALATPWGCCGLGQAHPPGKASAVHGTYRGEDSQCFQVRVHISGAAELSAQKWGEGGTSW